ncbi:hypothetical protein M3664_04575 [Paenibacillus lautus]|uniref:hypothetical protein n=1 Tax=Paenibacillus lautus TaxID=1401 RepID=UPI00203E806D|nr:hypothetical protein [Paenibacillus lautus]MCM3257056.1 hypothetical protein [Paenibacillus lautus]
MHQFTTVIDRVDCRFVVKVLSEEAFASVEIKPNFNTEIHLVYVNISNGNIKTNSYKALFHMHDINLNLLNWKLA